jgi:hypothetical protein
MLRAIISNLALDGGAEALQESLNTGAEAFRERIWGEMESEFNALTTTQRAVLVVCFASSRQGMPTNHLTKSL